MYCYFKYLKNVMKVDCEDMGDTGRMP
jgi:hypothetical protein